MKTRSRITYVAGAIAVLAVTAAASGGCGNSNNQSATERANNNERAQQGSVMDRLQANQPIPSPDFSVQRQNLIDIENAQISGTATTTFGPPKSNTDPTPSWTCPSIGFGLPADAELTNPQQPVWSGGGRGYAGVTIAQADPNGVYVGPTSGTYVVCVSPSGLKYYMYEEGFVKTVGGPAHWDATQGVVLDGAPSIPVTGKK